MNTQLFILIFSLFFITLTESYVVTKEAIIQPINNEPIVGILSQELIPGFLESYSDRYDSYIPAADVKFFEGAGSRVVPIRIGQDEAYYENLMKQINGVFLPSGDIHFNVSNGYAEAGGIIYKIAKRFNDNGDYFPIFGVCQGFELLTYLTADRVEHRTPCNSDGLTIPLNFTTDYKHSRMFENAPEHVINILGSENVTINLHLYCVTIPDLKKVNLTDKLRFMSVNNDFNGLEFISSIEDKKYPFYGLQWHPEKIDYEWLKRDYMPHGEKGSIVHQYFANLFVNEARKNLHKFDDEEEEIKSLIYNYPTTYTYKTYIVQTYFFNHMKCIQPSKCTNDTKN